MAFQGCAFRVGSIRADKKFRKEAFKILKQAQDEEWSCEAICMYLKDLAAQYAKERMK